MKRYLDWLSRQPCERCGSYGVEVAHVRGPLSRKTGLTMPRRNREAMHYCIPLCPACHRHGQDSIHAVGETEFFRAMGRNAHQVVASYLCRFTWEHAA